MAKSSARDFKNEKPQPSKSETSEQPQSAQPQPPSSTPQPKKQRFEFHIELFDGQGNVVMPMSDITREHAVTILNKIPHEGVSFLQEEKKQVEFWPGHAVKKVTVVWFE